MLSVVTPTSTDEINNEETEMEKTFGATLRAAREAMHMTRETLGSTVKCSSATIQNTENGISLLRDDIALRVFEVLNLDVDEMKSLLHKEREEKEQMVTKSKEKRVDNHPKMVITAKPKEQYVPAPRNGSNGLVASAYDNQAPTSEQLYLEVLDKIRGMDAQQMLAVVMVVRCIHDATQGHYGHENE